MDAYQLAATMRLEDIAEVAGYGKTPLTAAVESYRDSLMRRTYFVDGELAAMAGLSGPFLADEGWPYLLTAYPIERAPFAVAREARKHVAEMLTIRSRLTGNVLSSYTKAVRLLELIGFTIGSPRAFGVNGELFSTFTLERP